MQRRASCAGWHAVPSSAAPATAMPIMCAMHGACCACCGGLCTNGQPSKPAKRQHSLHAQQMKLAALRQLALSLSLSKSLKTQHRCLSLSTVSSDP